MTALDTPTEACLDNDSVIALLAQPAFLLDDDNTVRRWNRAGAHILDLDADAIGRLSDAAYERLAAFSGLLADAAGPFVLTLASRDGERVYAIDGLPALSAPRPPLVLRDDTELVATRRALAESEHRFRAITHAALDAMIVMDARGRIRFWNPSAERIFGWSAAQTLGRDMHRLLTGEAEQAAYQGKQRQWAVDGHSEMFDRVHRLQARNRSGDVIEVELSLTSLRARGEWQAFGVVRDVTRRVREEAQLLEAEQRWQFALEGGGDAVWDWNVAGGDVLFGPRYKAMLGYAEDEFENTFDGFYSRVHPDDQPRVRARLEQCLATDGSDDYRCDFRMRTHDGDYRWIHGRGLITQRDEAGEPLRMVGTHRDITEQRNAEQALQRQLAETQRLNTRLEEVNVQLLQSEKMASIGQLAAGVAHEMNTPLAFVGSNVGTLEKYVGQLFEMAKRAGGGDEQAELGYLQEDLPDLFSETRDGIDRVRRIVADLKDFSRVGEQNLEFFDLHRGLDSTLNILRNEIKHRAEVVREYGTLPEVWCIPSQINQVFMNLLVNAAQAIDKRGTITIATTPAGDGVQVCVGDDGCGIEPDKVERIFEPFFTTKAVGKGTGLGLSISYNIVKKHGGRIEVDSQPGTGTRFTVWLPLRHPEADTNEEANHD